MRRRRIFSLEVLVVALLALWAGCASTPYGTPTGGVKGSYNWQKATAAETRKRLEHLELGMTKSEVEAILIVQPHQVDMGPDGTEYSLYLTALPAFQIHGEGITDEYLTPVGFRDGKVIGWGRNLYEQGSKIEIEIAE